MSTDTTEIVVASTSNLASANPMLELISRLPARFKDDLLLLQRPSIEEMSAIVSTLPDEEKEKMLTIIRKTRPKKQGAHATNMAFEPIDIRINQGTGNDPARPKKHPPGDFYTKESINLGSPFDAVVIGFYEGRTLWPPRQQGQTDDNQSKAPICTSLDQKMGSRYGECAACPNSSKKYTEGGCAKEVKLFLMDRAFTGIYSLTFTKTSLYAGQNLIKTISKSSEIWSRWIKFGSEEKTPTGTNNRYFVITASPITEPLLANTPPELNNLFSALSRLLDADVYYPKLADVYDRRASDNVETIKGETVDPAKLLETMGESPDYSNEGDPTNV